MVVFSGATATDGARVQDVSRVNGFVHGYVDNHLGEAAVDGADVPVTP